MIVDAHPWLRFTTGVIVGCWIGWLAGCGVALLFASRRLRQAEQVNRALRVKLRSRSKPRGQEINGGRLRLVTPAAKTNRPAGVPPGRVASSGR